MVVVGAEQREVGYMLKLKQSRNVKKLIVKLFGNDQWGMPDKNGKDWRRRCS